MKNKYNKAWHENSWKTADEKKRESVAPDQGALGFPNLTYCTQILGDINRGFYSDLILYNSTNEIKENENQCWSITKKKKMSLTSVHGEGWLNKVSPC